MKSKFKKAITASLALVTGFSFFGSTKVSASEANGFSNNNPNFVYTTAEALGIPTELDIDFESEGDFTQSSFTLNGFNYAVNEDGSLGTVTIADNPESYESIMLVDRIGNNMFNGNAQYNDIDFHQFTNVKNLVLNMQLSSLGSYYASFLPKVENLYVLADQMPPLNFNSSTLKNVILCRSFPVLDGDDWSTNSNFDLSSYPTGVKFVTIDGFKFVNGKYIESYRNNSNYKGTEDLNCYVIPNEDLPIPAESMKGNNFMESGGVRYTFSRSRLDIQERLSVAYIDPTVTKIIFNLENLKDFMGGIFGDFHKLDTIYVLEGTPVIAYDGLRATNIYLPLPETFLYSDYTDFDNVYFYNTEEITSLSITDSGIGSEQEVGTNFYVQEATTLSVTATNEQISSKVTTYSEEITPVVEIEIDGKTKSTTEIYITFEDFKNEFIAELEAEKDNVTDSGNTTNPDDTEDNKDETTNNDKNEDSSIKDTIKDTFEDTKEKIKESKPLQVLTATVSAVVAGLLVYGVYLLTRKVIRWVKD